MGEEWWLRGEEWVDVYWGKRRVGVEVIMKWGKGDKKREKVMYDRWVLVFEREIGDEVYKEGE